MIEQIAKGLLAISTVVFVVLGIPTLIIKIARLPKSSDYFDHEQIGESHTIYYVVWVVIVIVLAGAYAIGKSIK